MAVVDTFVWQALASVAIPGFTINRVCAASLYILGTATRWPLAARKWTTTALGLLVIPIIIHPIDRWAPLPASGVVCCTGSDKLCVLTLPRAIAAEAGLVLGAPRVERIAYSIITDLADTLSKDSWGWEVGVGPVT